VAGGGETADDDDEDDDEDDREGKRPITITVTSTITSGKWSPVAGSRWPAAGTRTGVSGVG